MPNHLTEKDVRDIAEYTRIGVEDADISKLTGELNSIIDELGPILTYDLEGVEPTFHPIGGLRNVLREDVEGASFTQQEALKNAPKQESGSFLIPAILNDEGDR